MKLFITSWRYAGHLNGRHSIGINGIFNAISIGNCGRAPYLYKSIYGSSSASHMYLDLKSLAVVIEKFLTRI